MGGIYAHQQRYPQCYESRAALPIDSSRTDDVLLLNMMFIRGAVSIDAQFFLQKTAFN